MCVDAGRFLRASPRCIVKNAGWLVAIDVVHVIVVVVGGGGGSGVPLTCTTVSRDINIYSRNDLYIPGQCGGMVQALVRLTCYFSILRGSVSERIVVRRAEIGFLVVITAKLVK